MEGKKEEGKEMGGFGVLGETPVLPSQFSTTESTFTALETRMTVVNTAVLHS